MTVITHLASPAGRPVCGSPAHWTTAIHAAVTCRRCLELMATKSLREAPKGVRFDSLAVGAKFRFAGAPDTVCEKVGPRHARLVAPKGGIDAAEAFPVRSTQIIMSEEVKS